LVTIVEPSFFPNEIFLLAIVTTVFVLIFLYLIRSLDSKKEVQLYAIERKIDEKMNESERILYESKFWYRFAPSDYNMDFLVNRHKDLIKKYQDEMVKMKDIRDQKFKFPLRELQEINKNPSSLHYFHKKRIKSSQ
jgi:hypothetical protein